MDNDTEKCLVVRLANDLDLTLVGFVRGRWMNVYTHTERIRKNGREGC
jgi:formate dehydrogenase assembly factor FdhD